MHVRDERGLTVVEVLVASLLMIVGVLGLLSVFPETLRSARGSGHVLILNHLAAEKAEQLRALDFSDGDLAIGTHPAQQLDSNAERYYPVPGMAQEYSLRWTVEAGPLDGGGVADSRMKTITVEATYDVRYTSTGVALPRVGSRTTASRTFLTN